MTCMCGQVTWRTPRGTFTGVLQYRHQGDLTVDGKHHVSETSVMESISSVVETLHP